MESRICVYGNPSAFLWLVREEIEVKVELLSITPNSEELIEKGARVCYDSPEKPETRKQFIQNLIKRGHLGVVEHGVATFRIEGVSRACSHQMVRSRLVSWNQRSQRYVKESGFKYVIPPSIAQDKEKKQRYKDTMARLRNEYALMIKDGIPPEDARFVLPNACETELIMTANFREFRHFLQQRLDKHAQWEIRELAKQILKILVEQAPSVFCDILSCSV